MFNTRNRRFGVGIAAVAATAALVLTGCSGSGDSGGDAGGDGEAVTITMLPKNLGNPYFA